MIQSAYDLTHQSTPACIHLSSASGATVLIYWWCHVYMKFIIDLLLSSYLVRSDKIWDSILNTVVTMLTLVKVPWPITIPSTCWSGHWITSDLKGSSTQSYTMDYRPVVIGVYVPVFVYSSNYFKSFSKMLEMVTKPNLWISVWFIV